MKEEDLDKHLKNLIIDGLIKEAEQDNADFEAAMRNISDEDFEEIIQRPARFKVRKNLRPWIVSAISAAAVILIVLLPSINYMNGKLCDSALYASSAYITASRGSLDIMSMTDTEVKNQLSGLEKRYADCLQANDADDLREAGWDLTMAYLKLHKKRDAVRVLKVLTEQYKGSDFGVHCAEMLKQLD